METVIEQLAAHVRRRPDHPAVICGRAVLTYRELWERSGGLAGVLRGHRLPPGSVVALYGPGTESFVVAALAVWRAGASWVPIDPLLPADRVAYLLDDSGARLVIATAPDRGLPATGLPIIPATATGTPAPDGIVAADDLAYVIYTSGSTGRPKGVAVEHGPLGVHLTGVIDGYGLTADDVIMGLSSPVFDASVEEIWATLAAGATLVQRGPVLWTGPQVFDRIRRHRVTVVMCPTAYFESFAPEASRDGAEAGVLDKVIFGGEAVGAATVRRWTHGPLGHVGLYNTYGPTEAIVTATCGRLARDWDGDDRVPMGGYLPGHEGVVLAPDGAEASTGELYLGGPCVARGYLNRPDLTADRFVPLPGRPGRWYRTGDLVTVDETGGLTFLGRADRQVKLRGYRIELDEVEHGLRSVPGVDNAAVRIEDGPAGQPRLVAYVAAGTGRSPAHIRRDAAAFLPRYMLPDLVHVLPDLPINANGKIDRTALTAALTPALTPALT